MATILLIEDDPLLADCYTHWLAAAGYAVTHVSSAQSALDALDAAPRQAIVLDLLLPGPNGVQVLHALRSHADFSAIPVVICSNALPKKVPDLAPYGVRAVLDKSVLNRATLCKTIAGVL